jgi:hypothetical protein
VVVGVLLGLGGGDELGEAGRPAWTPHALRDWHSKLKIAGNRDHTPGLD